MKHPNILARQNMDQLARLDMADLDEVRLERQNVRVRQRKRVGRAFPRDLPVGSRAPSVAVDEEREVAVVEKELAVDRKSVV